MTNEQIEEIIDYLSLNKNNLPDSLSELLQNLFDKVNYEKSKAELISLDNVIFVDSLDDNMLDFILNNQALLTDKNISNEEFNKLAVQNKVKKIANLSDDSSFDFSSLLNEQHPKDKGSKYPTNVPDVISKEEIRQKFINFPGSKVPEENNSLEIKELNKKIKAYHEQHKSQQIEMLKEKQTKDTTNSLEWIQVSELEKLQEDLATFGTPDKIGKAKKYLDKLQTHKPVLQFNQFDRFNSLHNDCPNFKEVAQFYKGSFVLNNSKYKLDKSYNAPTPILLLGEPGIGKTHFAKRLAKLLGTTFHFLDSNSITASWVLTGSSGQWQNADAGSIFKYILDSNTISPVVILDEIDKLSQGKNYDPFSVFHQMFEPENACHFKDEFLNVTFDASKIIYILTANNVNNIPESLLSRMRVFDIQRPNDDEMKVIAQNIYSEIIGNTPLLQSHLSQSILNKLVALPPRDIKKQISNAVFSQLAQSQELSQELILDIQKIQKSWGFSSN